MPVLTSANTSGLSYKPAALPLLLSACPVLPASPPPPCSPQHSGREPEHVETALNRALDAYYGGPQWWREQLVPRAMRQDWSWSRSAATYLDIYRSML